MLKEEFENLVRELLPEFRGVTDAEYKVIETVYAFHPSIGNKGGKNQVADLYVKFGYIIFLDMLPRAKVMENIEFERYELNAKYEALKQQEVVASSQSIENVCEILRDF